jgi:uncharacterized DUF497 family protein
MRARLALGLGQARKPTEPAQPQVSFELAERVFADPLAIALSDLFPDQERWRTIGSLPGSGIALLVVHTWPEDDGSGEEVGRVISARKATSHARRAYDEGTF